MEYHEVNRLIDVLARIAEALEEIHRELYKKRMKVESE